jgi:hypothetical protein
MSEKGAAAIVAVKGLREAVERAADALASPRVEALLACEAAIEAALSDVTLPSGLAADERAAVRAEIDAARGALLRCRRLGASLTEFIRLSFESHGGSVGYGSTEPVYSGHTLDARV